MTSVSPQDEAGEARRRSAAPAAALGPVSAKTPRYKLTRPVFFVGFMGAGKTSVFRKLARSLGLVSIDMDTYIERREDCKVSQIFAEQGEAGFRRIETQVLQELAQRDPALISCGGGVVTTEENRRILKEAGSVVFLRVTADEARGRISDLSTRPLFNEIEEARARNAARLPLYQEVATIIVDTSGKSVGAIAREVRQALIKEGTLCALPR